jgi:invasion protein IalB
MWSCAGLEGWGKLRGCLALQKNQVRCREDMLLFAMGSYVWCSSGQRHNAPLLSIMKKMIAEAVEHNESLAPPTQLMYPTHGRWTASCWDGSHENIKSPCMMHHALNAVLLSRVLCTDMPCR